MTTLIKYANTTIRYSEKTKRFRVNYQVKGEWRSKSFNWLAEAKAWVDRQNG